MAAPLKRRSSAVMNSMEANTVHVALVDPVGNTLALRQKASVTKFDPTNAIARWQLPGGAIKDLGGEVEKTGIYETPQVAHWRIFEEQTGYRLGVNGHDGTRGGEPCWPFFATFLTAQGTSSATFLYTTELNLLEAFGPGGTLKNTPVPEAPAGDVSLAEASDTEFFAIPKSVKGFPLRHFRFGPEHLCMGLITAVPTGERQTPDHWHLLDKTGKSLGPLAFKATVTDIRGTVKVAFTSEERALLTPIDGMKGQFASLGVALDTVLEEAVAQAGLVKTPVADGPGADAGTDAALDEDSGPISPLRAMLKKAEGEHPAQAKKGKGKKWTPAPEMKPTVPDRSHPSGCDDIGKFDFTKKAAPVPKKVATPVPKAAAAPASKKAAAAPKAESPTKKKASAAPAAQLKNKHSHVGDGQPWYHGNIKKSDCEALLLADGGANVTGKFLVRAKDLTDCKFVLSVIYKGKVTHHTLERTAEGEEFALNKTPSGKTTLEDCVAFYRTKQKKWPVPLTEHPAK